MGEGRRDLIDCETNLVEFLRDIVQLVFTIALSVPFMFVRALFTYYPSDTIARVRLALVLNPAG